MRSRIADPGRDIRCHSVAGTGYSWHQGVALGGDADPEVRNRRGRRQAQNRDGVGSRDGYRRDTQYRAHAVENLDLVHARDVGQVDGDGGDGLGAAVGNEGKAIDHRGGGARGDGGGYRVGAGGQGGGDVWRKGPHQHASVVVAPAVKLEDFVGVDLPVRQRRGTATACTRAVHPAHGGGRRVGAHASHRGGANRVAVGVGGGSLHRHFGACRAAQPAQHDGLAEVGGNGSSPIQRDLLAGRRTAEGCGAGGGQVVDGQYGTGIGTRVGIDTSPCRDVRGDGVAGTRHNRHSRMA